MLNLLYIKLHYIAVNSDIDNPLATINMLDNPAKIISLACESGADKKEIADAIGDELTRWVTEP